MQNKTNYREVVSSFGFDSKNPLVLIKSLEPNYKTKSKRTITNFTDYGTIIHPDHFKHPIMTITEAPVANSEDPLTLEDGTAAENDPADATTAAENADEVAAPTDRSTLYKKIAIGLVLLGLIIFVTIDSLTNQWVRNGILAFLEWIENNTAAGVFAFMAVYFAATICFVPGSILTLGAGFVFSSAFDSLGRGVLLGTVAVWVGASLGAIASFLLGRYLFRDGCVGRLTEKYTVFKALDNALMDKGLRIMILLRLSPIVPFNALNYIMGVTGVKLWHYVVACAAMLPGTILYVFLGASAGSLSEIGGEDGEEQESNRTVTIIVVVVGVVFGILAIGVTSYYAKKELNKVLEDKAAEENNASSGETNEADEADDEELSA